MKRIFILLSVSLLIFAGCGNTMNTPTSKVEEFLGKYQKLDKNVISELDEVLKKEDSMSDEQKKEYKILLEKQYQNLSYKIKNEEVEGDTATVDVEIEVLDYQTSINKAKEYYAENKDEFDNKDNKADKDNEASEDKNNKDTDSDSLKDKAEDVKDETLDKIDSISSFIDYKIKELKDVNDKTKYDLTFNLTKKDGKWKIDELSDEDRQKLHGLY